MISLLSKNFNILINTSNNLNMQNIQNLYNSLLLNYDFTNIICNHCNHSDWHYHGSYTRYINIRHSDFLSFKIPIDIQRIKCAHCNHTHALIPDFIIPYTQILTIDFIKLLVMLIRSKKQSIFESLYLFWKLADKLNWDFNALHQYTIPYVRSLIQLQSRMHLLWFLNPT